mmetsp:Transcript_8573/g.13872  ORF Transcript_8573/g.13872 Transcript_8573/m.13872 type:complete len:894 (+) Transcript_8573:218-2899(+)
MSTPTYKLRFLLPNGAREELKVGSLNVYLSSIWDDLWNKRKSLAKHKTDQVMRLSVGEIYFHHDTARRAFMLHDAFAGQNSDGIPEIVLYDRNDIGDKAKRAAKLLSPDLSIDPILCEGNLKKRGAGVTAGFKKRYFVLQRETLFYFSDEKSYKSQRVAKGCVPMGSCIAKKVILEAEEGFAFEIKAKHLDMRDFQLVARESHQRDMWLQAIRKCCLRRVASVCALVIEEMDARNELGAEGIFRVPGSDTEQNNIMSQYDNGEFPDLKTVSSIHTLAGVLKKCLRSMSDEPVIPYFLAGQFLNIGLSLEVSEDVMRDLKNLVAKLPDESFGILAFLCRFLNRVASFSSTNRMVASNLGLVFGPNLIRRGNASPHLMAQDTAATGQVTCFLIENSLKLFGPARIRGSGAASSSSATAAADVKGGGKDRISGTSSSSMTTRRTGTRSQSQVFPSTVGLGYSAAGIIGGGPASAPNSPYDPSNLSRGTGGQHASLKHPSTRNSDYSDMKTATTTTTTTGGGGSSLSTLLSSSNNRDGGYTVVPGIANGNGSSECPRLSRKALQLRQKCLDSFMEWEKMLIQARVHMRHRWATYASKAVSKEAGPDAVKAAEEGLKRFVESHLRREGALRQRVKEMYNTLEVYEMHKAASSSDPVVIPGTSSIAPAAHKAAATVKNPHRPPPKMTRESLLIKSSSFDKVRGSLSARRLSTASSPGVQTQKKPSTALQKFRRASAAGRALLAAAKRAKSNALVKKTTGNSTGGGGGGGGTAAAIANTSASKKINQKKVAIKRLAIARHKYTGGFRKNELLFGKGEVMAVTDDTDARGKGWWFGYVKANPTREGWFPAGYVQTIGFKGGAPPPPGPPPSRGSVISTRSANAAGSQKSRRVNRSLTTISQ